MTHKSTIYYAGSATERLNPCIVIALGPPPGQAKFQKLALQNRRTAIPVDGFGAGYPLVVSLAVVDVR